MHSHRPIDAFSLVRTGSNPEAGPALAQGDCVPPPCRYTAVPPPAINFLSSSNSPRCCAVFASVRSKLAEVDPEQLSQAITAQFDEMLGQLALEELMPDLEPLDAIYAEVVGKIQALDPSSLVLEVVQPEFEEALTPLLEQPTSA